MTKTFKEETHSSSSNANIKKLKSIDGSQSDETSKPQNPNVTRSKTNGKDFVFGLKSAFMSEEFEITKTNKHNNKQRRILVIEGTAIYHKKQCIDTKTGNVRDPQNFFTMQSDYQEMNDSMDVLYVAETDFQKEAMSNGSGSNSSSLISSFRGEDSARKSKNGVISKFQSFMTNKVFTGKQKHRFVQNILEINQLLMDNPNAVDKPRKGGGIFSKSSKKKGEKD